MYIDVRLKAKELTRCKRTKRLPRKELPGDILRPILFFDNAATRTEAIKYRHRQAMLRYCRLFMAFTPAALISRPKMLQVYKYIIHFVSFWHTCIVHQKETNFEKFHFMRHVPR